MFDSSQRLAQLKMNNLYESIKKNSNIKTPVILNKKMGNNYNKNQETPTLPRALHPQDKTSKWEHPVLKFKN